MSALCSLATAFGIAMSGCVDVVPQDRVQPPDDPEVLSVTPPPLPPKPEPPPAPLFAPIIMQTGPSKEELAEQARAEELRLETERERTRREQEQRAHEAEQERLRLEDEAWRLEQERLQLERERIGRTYLHRRGQTRGGSAGGDATTLEERRSAVGGATPMSAPAGGFVVPPIREASLSLPGYQAQKSLSGKPVDNSRILASDRYITGILETGINSQIDGMTGGPVVIQVTRHVYGYHDRKILIPKGSRLECAYKSPKKIGMTRVDFLCGRILMGETRVEIYELQALVADQQARIGLTGAVDNRFWEKYGTAFMLTALSTGVRAATMMTPQQEYLADQSSMFNTAGRELSQQFGQITANVLEKTMDISPVITIPQGTRVTIRPQSDWYLAPADI